MTLCKKKAELQTSDADRDALEARDDFRRKSGDLIYRHHVMPRD